MAIPRVFALAGIVGPVLFTLIVVIAGLQRPDYSHWAQFMSELGETGSSTQGLMNFAGFLPAGLLMLASSLALLSRFRGSWQGSVGPLLVLVSGCGMFAAGLFPCDTGCTPEVPSATQGIHNLAGGYALLLLALAPMILAFRFRQLERWRPLFTYSVATSVLSVVALVAQVWSLSERAGSGFFQRVLLGLPFLWLAIVSWRIWMSEVAPTNRSAAAADQGQQSSV